MFHIVLDNRDNFRFQLTLIHLPACSYTSFSDYRVYTFFRLCKIRTFALSVGIKVLNSLEIKKKFKYYWHSSTCYKKANWSIILISSFGNQEIYYFYWSFTNIGGHLLFDGIKALRICCIHHKAHVSRSTGFGYALMSQSVIKQFNIYRWWAVPPTGYQAVSGFNQFLGLCFI